MSAADRSAAYSDGWTGTLAPSLRCDYCGDEVVGIDAPSLDSAKEAHRENCPERTVATPYDGGHDAHEADSRASGERDEVRPLPDVWRSEGDAHGGRDGRERESHGELRDRLPERAPSVASPAARTRQVEVATGHEQDVCPLCGIWRMNAGWITATCGTHLRKPGCFVVPLLTGKHPRKPGGGTVALHD